MAVDGVGEQIRAAALEWTGVTAHPHRFGGTEFRLNGREIGHIHGDQLLDIPFPRRIRDIVVAQGRALPHHILPQSGWVSFYIRDSADVAKAVALLHESYELAAAQQARRRGAAPAQTEQPGPNAA